MTGLDGRATQITDVLADPDYGLADEQRVADYRTVMGVPMLLEGEVVGCSRCANPGRSVQ